MPRKYRAIWLVAAVPLSLGVLAASCEYVPAFVGDPENPSVAVFGDSLTFRVVDPLMASMTDRFFTSIDAAPGQGLETNRPYAKRMACVDELPEVCTVADVPDAVVFNLGTNDVMSAYPAIESAARLDEQLGWFDGKCKVVFTVTETSANPVLDQAIAHEYNVHIRALPDVVVADWAVAITGQEATYLSTDNVHPTPEGQALIIELVNENVDSCFAGP